MYIARTRTQTKNAFLPKRLASLPALLKKRTNQRSHDIKAELAARTLYVVDGEDIVMSVPLRICLGINSDLAMATRGREVHREHPSSYLLVTLLTYST